MANWSWYTTYPSGRAHTHGADDGQTGWRLHLVDTDSLKKEKRWLKREGLTEVLRGSALCGTRPYTGWGLDLFIDTTCARCERAALKRGITMPAVPK